MLNSWKGKITKSLTSDATVSEIATVYIRQGAEYLWADFENGNKALGAFQVSYQGASDADFHVVASVTSDFTTDIQSPISNTSGDPTSLDSDTSFLIRSEVKGTYAVKFEANPTSDTSIIFRFQVR